jgi:hypothetical protein
MNIKKETSYSALTGDAINSSKLDSENRWQLHDAILKTGDDLKKSFPGLVVGGINVFRGDSVQFLINEPGKSLRAALFFRAALRASSGSLKADMRFAIGVGTIDFMPEVSQGGADGEAYRLSGMALDGMGSKQTLRFALPRDLVSSRDFEMLNAFAVLVAAIADRWTEKQALAVKGALLGYTQDEICRTWSTRVSRQAVAKNLDAAGWFAVERAVQFFEKFGLALLK